MKLKTNWYVIYTRARHEKKLEKELNDIGVEAYCPKFKKLSIWSDRKKVIEEPLFKSYCFVKIEENQKYEVLRSFSAVKFISFEGNLVIVSDKIIQNIQQFLIESEHKLITSNKIKDKDKVTIESGVFKNKRATVLESKSNHLIVLLEEIGIKVKFNKEKIFVKKT